MPDVHPRLAIVTGAASGLGRAFCRQVIAAPGPWHVVAVDLDEANAQQTLAQIRQPGRVEVQCERFDVADADAWSELRQRLQRDWPRLDLLVNCAGICMSAEVGDGALADWRRIHEVNYLGVLNACHVMTSWLKQSAALNPAPPSPNPVTPRYSEGSGPPPKPALINIASILGLLPAPALAAYSASKAAVIALSEAMYAELRPNGVNVTVAAPGFFHTSLLDNGAFASQRHRDQADELVRTSLIDADSVARETLRASAQGRLYAVMGRRARWFWRLKRGAPTALLNSLSHRYQRMMHGD
ncbi:MAG: SDR family NAD(P)-dependent oxidoreductase [Pirellulales bacterium]|nr:SDR family NAD(P)-dependent oxidoreductase [Pirellulales bacterium]